MAVYAYIRVSSLDQNPDLQQEAFKKAYPDAVCMTEKVSGTSMKGR